MSVQAAPPLEERQKPPRRRKKSAALYEVVLPLIATAGLFLLWEAAYAELVYQNVLWPDYGADGLADVIEQYRNRDRRFGGRAAPAEAAAPAWTPLRSALGLASLAAGASTLAFYSLTPAQAAALAPQPGQAQRLFDGACAACHHDGDGPRLLGVNVPLALNSNLHSDRPDNLLQVIVHGIREPAARDIGFMPGFGHALSDAQITELAGYMRQRYAPGRPAWRDVPEALARVRAGPAHP